MLKKKMRWASAITSLIAGVAAIGGYILAGKLMYIEKKDTNLIRERELKSKRFDENWYNLCDKTDLYIKSPNGYTIRGIFLRPLDTTNTIIICHGVTENKINSIRYARMFERLGYNSVIFDQRRHGDTGGKTTSYGYYEKYDLQALVKTIRNMIGADAELGIHGESMGAATMILYAGTVEDQADFYISDCSYADFSELLEGIFHNKTKIKSKIPLHLANIFLRLRDGYSLRHITPKEAVANVKAPMLFIHSIPDDFTPVKMTLDLYIAKKSAKELKLFDTGLHAQSFNQNPDEYEQVIRNFIDKYKNLSFI